MSSRRRRSSPAPLPAATRRRRSSPLPLPPSPPISPDEDGSLSPSPDHRHHQQERRPSRREIRLSTTRRPGGGSRTRLESSSDSPRRPGSSSNGTWYERMMPECLMTLTSPITGYEYELETRPDMDEHEFQILERERIRRNRRIRRRVLAVVLMASLASAYFIWRGRLPGRRPGVRGAISSVTDGLSKSIQDTMGK